MQELLDNLSKGWRAERSLSQMTLGELISELEKMPQDKKFQNTYHPHSYRGYYSDLALEENIGVTTVGDLLKTLKEECLNMDFTGYKGGEYYMDENTPMWIADYGSTGKKIVSIKDGDILSFETQYEE